MDILFSIALSCSNLLSNSSFDLFKLTYLNKALLRYVSLKRSKLELERRLEQLRAMENNMSIHVGYINSSPLSVDTEKDLIKIKKLMGKNNE